MAMLDFIYMGSADMFGTERERNKFKMKMFVSSGIRTPAMSLHDRKVSCALDRTATLVIYQVEYL